MSKENIQPYKVDQIVLEEPADTFEERIYSTFSDMESEEAQQFAKLQLKQFIKQPELFEKVELEILRSIQRTFYESNLEYTQIACQLLTHEQCPSRFDVSLFQFIDLTKKESKEFILKEAAERVQKGTLADYKAALKLYYGYLFKTQSAEKYIDAYVEIQQPYLQAGGTILEGSLLEFGNIKNDLTPENADEKLKNVFMGLELVSDYWIGGLINKQILHPRYDKIRPKIFTENTQVQQKKLAILLQLLRLNFQNEDQVQNCIFSTSGIEKFDNLVNSLKSKVIRVFSGMVTSIFASHEEKKVPQQAQILARFLETDLCPGIAQSLYQYCTSKKFDHNSPRSEPLDQILFASMRYLAAAMDKPAFFKFFIELRSQIIIDICMPILATGEKEMFMFENDPKEFVELAIDTCDKQQSETSKGAAAHLLEKLIDNIDGSLSIAVNLAGAILDFSLSKSQISEIDQKYPPLANFKNGYFMSKVPTNIQTETSLMVLSILSYIIVIRKDLTQIILYVLQKHLESFNNSAVDQLVLARYCQFMPYFIEELVKLGNNEFGEKLFQPIFNVLDTSKFNHAAMRLQVYDTIKTGLLDEFFEIKLKNMIGATLEVLNKNIVESNEIELFQTICEIINSTLVGQIDNKIFMTTIKNICLKLVYKFEDSKKVAEHCTTIIASIFGSEKIMKFDEIDSLKDELDSLIDVLIKSKMGVFYEDLFLIMKSIVQNYGIGFPFVWKLLSETLSIVKENHRFLGDGGFEFINQLIIKDTNKVIKKNPAYIESLISIAGLLLKSEKDGDHLFVFSRIAGANILHLILQYHGHLELEDLAKILNCVLNYLEEEDFELRRVFGAVMGIVLSAFMADLETTLTILIRRNKLDTVMKYLMGNLEIYAMNEYDNRLFVISICSIFQQDHISEKVRPYLPQMMDSLATILILLEQTQNNQKKALGGEEDDDDEEEEDEEDAMEVAEKKLTILESLQQDRVKDALKFDLEPIDFGVMDFDQFPTVLKGIESKINDSDEFKTFREMIQKMKKDHQDLLKEIGAHLSDPRKMSIRQIIKSQRVVTGEGGHQTQARKIVRVKRRLNKERKRDM